MNTVCFTDFKAWSNTVAFMFFSRRAPCFVGSSGGVLMICIFLNNSNKFDDIYKEVRNRINSMNHY